MIINYMNVQGVMKYMKVNGMPCNCGVCQGCNYARSHPEVDDVHYHKIIVDLEDQDDVGPTFTCETCPYMWSIFFPAADRAWWLGTLASMRSNDHNEYD